MKWKLFLILYFANLSVFAIEIDTLIIEGCKHTKRDFICKFVYADKEDIDYNDSLLKLDLQQLKDLRFFKEIDIQTDTNESGLVVKFILSELLTTLPFFSYGATEENYQLRVGLFKFNFLGVGASFGGKYMRYDDNTYYSFLEIPFLFMSNIGMRSTMWLIKTKEPFESMDGYRYYSRHKNYFNQEIKYSFDWQHSLGVQVEVFEETFTPYDDEPAFAMNQFDGYGIGLKYLKNEIRYNKHLFEGSAIQAEYLFKNDWHGQMGYHIVKASAKGFKNFGRSNLAARLTTGFSTNKYEAFAPFVADNYLNIRGAGDRVRRGSAEIVLNFEERFTLYQNRLGAIQGVAFADLGTWRMVGNNFESASNPMYWMAYSGIGVRITCFLFYDTIVRLDYGVNTQEIQEGGFVFGLGHYF